MKFSIIFVFTLYGMMALPVSLTMPIFYGRNENVGVHTPPSRSELEVRGPGMGGAGEEFGEALAAILTGIIDGIAEDKFVSDTACCARALSSAEKDTHPGARRIHQPFGRTTEC